ncbi:MAG TPA: Uma2 family endonuclease [Acidisphaera sp.]|nr:Uma2 family endonuclease [Acidisphaera sp.]
MNQLARRPLPHMSAEEFLAWPGDGTGRRFQLVDGEVRAMSPASRTHGVIQATLARLIGNAIDAAELPLQVVTEGAIIPGMSASDNVRVPDIVVAPDDDMGGDQVVTDPVLMVEVLSPGNMDDTRDNVRAYATLPSVREIVVVHSARLLAEVHRRDASGVWLADPELVGSGDRLRLASVGLDCRLDDVYAKTWLTRNKR